MIRTVVSHKTVAYAGNRATVFALIAHAPIADINVTRFEIQRNCLDILAIFHDRSNEFLTITSSFIILILNNQK